MYNKSEHIMLYEKALGKEDFSHLHNKTIFITGATGFLGMWLIRSIDYLNKTIIGSEIVNDNGGEVKLVEYIEDRSTTSIINKIKEIY